MVDKSIVKRRLITCIIVIELIKIIYVIVMLEQCFCQVVNGVFVPPEFLVTIPSRPVLYRENIHIRACRRCDRRSSGGVRW